MRQSLSRSHRIVAIRRVLYPATFIGYGLLWPTEWLVLIDGHQWRRVWWDRDGYFVIYQNQTYSVTERDIPMLRNRDTVLFLMVFLTFAVMTIAFLYYNWNRRF